MVMVKRPVNKEQHLCADKAYDAKDVREFVAVLEGYEDHIKVNLRKTAQSDDDDDELAEKEGSEELYPLRRWVVERTISWLTKCVAVSARAGPRRPKTGWR